MLNCLYQIIFKNVFVAALRGRQSQSFAFFLSEECNDSWAQDFYEIYTNVFVVLDHLY